MSGASSHSESINTNTMLQEESTNTMNENVTLESRIPAEEPVLHETPVTTEHASTADADDTAVLKESEQTTIIDKDNDTHTHETATPSIAEPAAESAVPSAPPIDQQLPAVTDTPSADLEPQVSAAADPQLAPPGAEQDTSVHAQSHPVLPAEQAPVAATETQSATSTPPIPSIKHDVLAHELAETAVATEERPREVETGGIKQSAITAALAEKETPGELAAISTRKKRLWWKTALPIVILVLLVVSILTPVIMGAVASISAYTTYRTLHDRAYNGYQHFLNLKTIYTDAKSHPGSVFDATTTRSAQKELAAARLDFQQLQLTLNNAALVQTIEQYLPQYRTQITSARAASQMGVDAADIGQSLLNAVQVLGPRLKNPLETDTTTPLLTTSDLGLVQTTINKVIPLVNDMQNQAHHVTISALPISQHQQAQLTQYLQFLPQVQAGLTWGQYHLTDAGWLLGVDTPRSYLIQPMDRGELRATGGFTGQYGELQVNGGRVAPLSLHNIALLEYSDNNPTQGQQAPADYRSWWPYANWGLRDSNLSADFPTSANININLYKKETGHTVDGVLMFTVFFAEHILQVTGPLQITKYHETITAQNLEDRLHYYQLGDGIKIQKQIAHITNDDEARKLFTQEVAHVLIDRVRHASPTELLQLAQVAYQDLQSRDLEVYVNNASVESILAQHNLAGQLDRSNTHDGLYVVQSNVSATKASMYVQTNLHDTVQVDAMGGATHNLQMQLVYQQKGPVYGLDTLRDYVRIYVPSNAKFLSGNGFDTGEPLCGGPFAACPDNHVYPHDELVCPTGQYNAGYAPPYLNDPYGDGEHPLDKVGKPTNMTSDEPERAMFGGYVVLPKNCTATITLSWYVPPMGNGPYSYLVQRQSGTYPQLDLNVQPAQDNSCPVASSTTLQYAGELKRDALFTLQQQRSGMGTLTHCSTQLTPKL